MELKIQDTPEDNKVLYIMSLTLPIQFLIWSATVQAAVKWCIFWLPKKLIIYSVLSIVHLFLKWNKAYCIFFCLFRTILCSCLSFSLYFNRLAYVCTTIKQPEFSSCSLSLKHMVSNTDRTLGKHGYTWVYRLTTDKKLYCIRICICQSPDKLQGFRGTPHLATSNSKSGRLLWEKILHEKKKML